MHVLDFYMPAGHRKLAPFPLVQNAARVHRPVINDMTSDPGNEEKQEEVDSCHDNY